ALAAASQLAARAEGTQREERTRDHERITGLRRIEQPAAQQHRPRASPGRLQQRLGRVGGLNFLKDWTNAHALSPRPLRFKAAGRVAARPPATATTPTHR